MTTTKRLLKRISELERQAQQQMILDYPLGKQVSWSHGSRDRGGEIVGHGWGLRVQILSIGRRMQWVYVSRLHQ